MYIYIRRLFVVAHTAELSVHSESVSVGWLVTVWQPAPVKHRRKTPAAAAAAAAAGGEGPPASVPLPDTIHTPYRAPVFVASVVTLCNFACFV